MNMVTAIYAREAPYLQLSANAQVSKCQTFAEQMGWKVPQELVFVDFGEYRERSALDRLLTVAMASKDVFQSVLADDISRISSTARGLFDVVNKLHTCRVGLFCINQGIQLEQDAHRHFLMMRCLYETENARNLSERVHSDHLLKIRSGFVAGGKRYGYHNVRVLNSIGGNGVRQEIHEYEMQIIREIFERYIRGERPADIADDLNNRGIPAPSGGKWKAYSVNAILRNEFYRGIVCWNRSKNLTSPEYGRKSSVPRPQCEWIRVEVPEMKIISDDTWFKAASIRAARSNKPDASLKCLDNRSTQIQRGNQEAPPVTGSPQAPSDAPNKNDALKFGDGTQEEQ